MEKIGPWREGFENYSPLFEPLFKKGGNCLINALNVGNDSVLIYSKVNLNKDCGECKVCSRMSNQIRMANKYKNLDRSHPVFEHIHLDNPVPSFFRVVPHNFVPRLCDKADQIILGGFVIGEYCPTRNILLGSDWTPEKKCEEYEMKDGKMVLTGKVEDRYGDMTPIIKDIMVRLCRLKGI